MTAIVRPGVRLVRLVAGLLPAFALRALDAWSARLAHQRAEARRLAAQRSAAK